MSTRPHVVLLHGWASHPQVFRAFARTLEARAHAHTLALPGYAGTAAPAPCTPERTVALLAAAAPRRCVVLGWSLGAQLALAWARHAPQQVTHLVLVAATPCFVQRMEGPNAWPHGASALTMRQFTSAMQRDVPGLLRRFVALQAQGGARVAGVAHKLRTALFTNALPAQEVLAAGLEWLRSTDLRAQLPSISQPALVIHGARDAVTPCAAGEALAALLPHAQLEVIADAGHAPFLSHPDRIVARMAAFIDESVSTV
jgi:pimeloyl-[acyl-carrier protein] methyl ester esterase